MSGAVSVQCLLCHCCCCLAQAMVTVCMTLTCQLVVHLESDMLCCLLQYLETLDEMENINNTSAQQTALSGSSSVDDSAVSSSGSMQYVEAGKPTILGSSSDAPSTPKASSTASKAQPLGYRSATCHRSCLLQQACASLDGIKAVCCAVMHTISSQKMPDLTKQARKYGTSTWSAHVECER